jgi:hypothetical protein
MSESISANALDESKAYWMDGECAVQLGDKALVREWRNLPLQSRAELLAILQARTSITNPKANTKAYTGVYRVLKVEDIVVRDRAGGTESLTLRETLASGFEGTSISNELPRLAGDVDVIGTGTTEAANIAHPSGTASIQEESRIVKIRWKDLNKDRLEALQSGRSATTALTLTVGTETKSGPWYLIGRSPGWEEDGSGFYEETWSLDEWHMESKGATGNRKVIVNRYIQGVPKDRVKTVLDAEISAGATYGDQGYTYDQKIYWRELNADIITEVSQAKKAEITAYNAEIDAGATTVIKYGESLYNADLAAYEAYTASAVDGKRKTLSKTVNADGTFSVTATEETVNYQYDSGSYLTREGTVYWWWGVNATAQNYSDVVSTANLTALTDNSLTKRINKYNRIDYVIIKQPLSSTFYYWGESITEDLTRIEREYAHMYNTTDKRERRYYRDVTYTFDLAIKNDYLAAHNFITGGEDGSKIESHGNGRYACFRVTLITPSDWELDETGVNP